MNKEDLIHEAMKARQQAYSAYSRFKVGAALLAKDGRIFAGCSFENASFVAGTCAERVALGNALVNGVREFTAIAVCGGNVPCAPCGVCRQALIEFGDMKVYCSDAAGKNVIIYQLSELLPEAFKTFEPDE